MSRHLDRLRRGERWWAAEFVLRTLGLALLYGCHQFALVAHRMVTMPPPHQATVGAFAVCLGVVMLLSSGIALTLFGPELFEDVPIPSRSAWYWKDH